MKFKINKLIGEVMGALSKRTTQFVLVGWSQHFSEFILLVIRGWAPWGFANLGDINCLSILNILLSGF